jgi:hypothetical protein
VDQRIVEARNRAVPRRAGGHQAHAGWKLFRRADIHACDLAVFDGSSSAFRHGVLRFDLFQVFADHVVHADADCIGFFTRFGHEDDIAIQLHAQTFQREKDDQICGHDWFVVLTAASPHVAVFHDGAEGIDGPLVALHGNHVGVGEDQQRFLRAISLEVRDQIGTVRVHGEGLGGNAFGFEDFLEVVNH